MASILEPTFPKGTRVRIGSRSELERFLAEWKYHHPLEPLQLEHADALTTVIEAAMYHGGDFIYRLQAAPGWWHEPCLHAA